MNRSNDYQVRLFAIFLASVGFIGIAAYFIVSPGFVADYLTLDGEVDPRKLQALGRLRMASLIAGVSLVLFSASILLLTRNSSHPWILKFQRRLKDLFEFDFNQAMTSVWHAIHLEHKRLFIINLTVIFLAHGFLLNNIIINWDGQGGLNFSSIAHLPSGRWFTAFLGIFSEHHYLPIPFFVFSIFILAVSGVLFTTFWSKTSFLFKVCLSAILVSFPSFAAGFAYNWVSPIYPIACLLTLLSVHFVLKSGYSNLLFAAIFFVLMLGTYQGFMAFGYALLLVVFLINLLEGKWNQLFLLKRFLMLGLGAPILYKLSSDFILYLIGMEYYDYRGADQIGVGYMLEHAPTNFIRSYTTLKSFFSGVYFSMPFYLLLSLLMLIGFGVFILLASVFAKRRSAFSGLITILLVLLSPPIIFVTQFLNTYIDTLLVFGMVPIIAGASYLINRLGARIIENFGLLLMALILLGFVNRSNGIHLKNHLWTQTSLRFANDLAIKIAELEGFNPDMRLVRVGNLSQQKFPPNVEAPFSEQGMTMVSPTGLSTWGEARTLNGVMNFLGFHYKTATLESLPQEMKVQIGGMPLYPEEGSLVLFEDYVVIKFGDLKDGLHDE